MSQQITILGCGPVGLTFANCLVRSPFVRSITLIDRKLPKPERSLPPIPNQRVYSINQPSLNLYRNLNILPTIRKYGIMNKIQVLSKESEEFVQWQENEANIIQNDELVASLMSNLQQHKGGKVRFIENQVEKIERNHQCEITLKDGEIIPSQLLVGSDGNKSKVKELSRVATYGWSYRQRAIVCTMKVEESNIKIGQQIYHEGNTLAFLPLWDNYISLVWSLKLPEFQHLMRISDEDFKKALNNVIENSNQTFKVQSDYSPILPIQQICNKRLSFPLSSLQAGNYTKNRIALIGDAAHSIHPMAGLGVNAGIADSVFLANNIIQNLKTGNDIGEPLALSPYESKSKALNYGNSVGMEAIKNAFQIDNTIVNSVRKLGMKVMNNSSSLKSIMKSLVEENSLAKVNQYQWDT